MDLSLPRPPGPHPTSEELFAARRDPAAPASAAHLAHAAACAACAEELLRQEAFDQPEPMSRRELDRAWERFGPPAAQPAPSSLAQGRAVAGRVVPYRAAPRATWLRPALALAATLAVVFVGFLAYQPQQPAPVPPDVVRSGQPGGPAEAWGPVGALAAAPREIRFANPAGDAVRVVIFDATRAYTWTSAETRASQVTLPEAERLRFASGVEYFWTVLGGDEEGAVARSFTVEKR